MSRPWVNNEDGPLCSCGDGTTVKTDGASTRPGLLCLVHTPEAGMWIDLPESCPDDFLPWSEAPDGEEALAGQMMRENVKGVFIPEHYARYFAQLIRVVGERPEVARHEALSLFALWRVLRTIEADA